MFPREFYSFLEKCFSRALLGDYFWFSQLFRWSVSESYLGPQKEVLANVTVDVSTENI